MTKRDFGGLRSRAEGLLLGRILCCSGHLAGLVLPPALLSRADEMIE